MLVFDTHGTLVIEHPWPTDGVRYVGTGNPADDVSEPTYRGLSHDEVSEMS